MSRVNIDSVFSVIEIQYLKRSVILDTIVIGYLQEH